MSGVTTVTGFVARIQLTTQKDNYINLLNIVYKSMEERYLYSVKNLSLKTIYGFYWVY